MSVLPVAVVVPTVGRPSLGALLRALDSATGPGPHAVLVVDDRPGAVPPLDLPATGLPVRVLRGRAAGPAAARNDGWRAAGAEWIAFLDDDVVPDPDWWERLADDLAGIPGDVAGSQGRLRVPLPPHRRPTDWERNVAGLESAVWATADLAYRRCVLSALGGFDERFPRAYREDADLGLRVVRAAWRIGRGRRTTAHPVRPADRRVSLRLQRGNADDPLFLALHGPSWRIDAAIPSGRRPRHLATTAAGLLAVAAAASGRHRTARLGALAWLAGTAELAAARIAPGPRTRDEVATMLGTSVLLPPAATWHWLHGVATLRRRTRRPGPVALPSRPPAAVLFDRDGTLVRDVPYNGDPGLVQPVPGARTALARLRAAGVRVGVVSNQSGIGRGLLTEAQVDAVNRRLSELLGPFDVVLVCPHAPDAGCGCRKPAPGLVKQAAAALGLDPEACAVVGDIGSDVEAAVAAGARAVLVPTEATRDEEVFAAPEVAGDLAGAVDLLLGGRR